MGQQTEVFESIGSSVRSQIARRVGSEVWFKRSQYRDPRYGYKWTPWTVTTTRPGVEYSCEYTGDYPLSECCSGYTESYRAVRVRLPRVA